MYRLPLPTRRLGAVLAAAAVLAAPSAHAGSGAVGDGSSPGSGHVAAGGVDSVIVQAHDLVRAQRAVRALGGHVTLALPVVDGFAATVPTVGRAALAADLSVRAVTDNTPVTTSSTTTSTTTSSPKHVLTREIGADEMHANGITGRGVGIALIDTGVSAVGDLQGRVRTVADPHQPVADQRTQVECVDLSGERTCSDSYGHGTFMAGLIAGSGGASAGTYRGVAPDAHLISVKIGGRDGSADVSKLLAAIQWTVSFKDTHSIRVLNLSLGTNSTVSPSIDPLNLAVQRAWRAGIVVVVAASNRGPAASTISKPADDPLVVTVGAVDDRETPGTSDDRLPSFTGRGPTAQGAAKPDVVAPGARVVSLRSPGSTIDALAPAGAIDSTYRRGSGTSMAAAVVSGATALLLQAQPTWTPDRVKYALSATAVKVASDDRSAVGSGLVHVPSAVKAPSGLANTTVTTLSNGTGLLDSSRGDTRVADGCTATTTCSPTGDATSDGGVFNRDQYVNSDWTGQSWYSSQWVDPNGQSWYSSEWLGQSWYGSSWYGSSWYGSDDTSSDTSSDYGTSLPGSAWYGAWG